MIKKIAVLTSGGDAPGMNSAIIGIVNWSQALGIEPYLIFNGYKGLHKGDIVHADTIKVSHYTNVGGTMIHSARYLEFLEEKTRNEAKQQLIDKNIDALIVIGGDGSYQGAQKLHELGIKTMAIPGTIDNDIASSDVTIGYDTALNTIVESIDKIRNTMNSHGRCAVVEVMGHGCGDLALYGGLATGSEVIVTNESKISKEEIAARVKKLYDNGRHSVIVIVSEMIFSNLNALAKFIQTKSGMETRAITLSHLQRGGTPTAMERVNSKLMGIHAVDLLNENKSGLAIGIKNGVVTSTLILEALKQKNKNIKFLVEKFNKLNSILKTNK